MDNKIISIIIPVYNAEMYIQTCLESVRKQTYDDIEIIVVDDGSTDNTVIAVSALSNEDERIRLIKCEHYGIMSTRIRGITEATGRWIAFVDSDDVIDENMFEALVTKMGKAEMITSSVKRQMPYGIVNISDDYEAGIYNGSELEKVLSTAIYDFALDKLQRLTPWLFNKVFLTELMQKVVSEINESQLSYAEDSIILYSYLLKCNSIVITGQAYYDYRWNKGSAIHAINDGILADINKVYLALKKKFEDTDIKLLLMDQLQKFIVCMTGHAFNRQMGFDEKLCPIEFVMDMDYPQTGKIVLYGAGKCGRDFYNQLCRIGKPPLIWVDINFLECRKKGFAVESPSVLNNMEFDHIIIAVCSDMLADDIRKNLIKTGVDEKKIYYKRPLRAF